MSALFRQPVLAGKICATGMRQMWPPDLGDSRDNLPGHAQVTDRLVSRHVLDYNPEERGQRTGPSAGARTIIKSYKTAWTWLHKLRRAMVRPGRDRLTGRVEVDETFTAGIDEGTRGRQRGTEGFDCHCSTRRWTGDWADSYASHPRRLGGKPDAFHPGSHRAWEHRSHGWLARLPASGGCGLRP